ncbi:MAG: GNAT family N-acetyltransferase [Candidatus Hatepunaea meridiana]|nr:GNAT family N-acetyltransferase [Candidatus Hatepunaea meridiana]
MRIEPITGDKLFIREHVLDDSDAYTDWQCDPDVGEFLSWLPRIENEAFQSLKDAIEQQYIENRRRFFMAVVRREDKKVVGDVGITLLNDQTGSIGWFIRKRYWGKGCAGEAAALMINCGFTKIGLNTIRASCRRENTISERIMRRCGFRLFDTTERRLNYTLRYEDWNLKSANQ